MIELWVEERAGRPAVNPVLRAVLDALRIEGRDVRVRVPERDTAPTSPELVLLKTVTDLALALAVATESLGTRFLNTAAATAAAADKAAVVARLGAAGVAVPETYLHAGTADDAVALQRPGGWFSKPVLGWHGIGVLEHDTFEDAVGARTPPHRSAVRDDGTRLVQRRVGDHAPDLKVYVAGAAVFAGTKRFSADSFSNDRVRAIDLDARTRATVRSCGEVLGLAVYGVDLRHGDAGPEVIDVNPFPGFRGFAGAVPALLDQVRRA